MSIISIKDLKKNLDKKEILKGINLEVKKGEIIALVGPSGSGKSTLLRCINRLIEADSGNILFEKNDIKSFQPSTLRRKIVLVHQESVMLNGSVFENVSYGPKIIGDIDRKHIKKCVLDAGLATDFLEKNAEKLSGGEKKRVALARAIALDPSVLLLDEPTNGVDPKNIQTVEKTIVDFSKNLGLTVLWVTHYVEQAMRVSDRIANIKEGVVKSVENTKDFKWEGAY